MTDFLKINLGTELARPLVSCPAIMANRPTFPSSQDASATIKWQSRGEWERKCEGEKERASERERKKRLLEDPLRGCCSHEM